MSIAANPAVDHAVHTVALTVTTDEIKGWGIVGCLIIVAITALVIKLAKSLVGRVIWTVAALALLAIVWTQRDSVSNSIKNCDPKILGIHLEISDPHTKAQCVNALHNG